MLKSLLIPALAAMLLLGGCIVTPNAKQERERLEELDAGKPLPPYDPSARRDDSFGD